MSAAAVFGPDTFDDFAERDDWQGFGYLGERRNAFELYGDAVVEVDVAVLADAASAGMTLAQLFTWANSKVGRHFGDVVLGGSPSRSLENRLAEARRFCLFPSQVQAALDAWWADYHGGRA